MQGGVAFGVLAVAFAMGRRRLRRDLPLHVTIKKYQAARSGYQTDHLRLLVKFVCQRASKPRRGRRRHIDWVRTGVIAEAAVRLPPVFRATNTVLMTGALGATSRNAGTR